MIQRHVRSLPLLLTLTVAALLVFTIGTVTAQSSVSVEMDEWSVTVQPGSVEAGPVTFDVTNAGEVAPHQLVVIRTDLAPDALPVEDSQVDEGQLDVIASTDLFQLGEGGMLDTTLEAGNYVLICNLEGHYELGMATAFSVTAAEEEEAPADEEPPVEEEAPADDNGAPVEDDEPEGTAPDPAPAGSGGLVGGSSWTFGAFIAVAFTLLLVTVGRRLGAGRGMHG